MNQYPAAPRHTLPQLYALLAQQVAAYQKQYRISSTSIPTETARALLDSITYTLRFAQDPHAAPEAQLVQGQTALNAYLEEAKHLWHLVGGTAPEFQNDAYQDTLILLRRYLDHYDPLLFAHQSPALLDYPLLNPQPEDQGITGVLGYLTALWLENQILDALPQGSVLALLKSRSSEFYRIPANLCEQPLLSALGCRLLGTDMAKLSISEAGQAQLLALLQPLPGEKLRDTLASAMADVCRSLGLRDPNALRYARDAITQLSPRIEAAAAYGDFRHIFPCFGSL